MNNELLELFIKEDCDRHAQSILLNAITTKKGVDCVADFTFNRFNVCLNFSSDEAVIDDELNPYAGECRLPLNIFAERVAAKITST